MEQKTLQPVVLRPLTCYWAHLELAPSDDLADRLIAVCRRRMAASVPRRDWR